MQNDGKVLVSSRSDLAILVGVVVVMFCGLGWMLRVSQGQYGVGISLLEDAAKAGANPSAMARRIFLLASAHQIVAFKAAAFGVSIVLALIGGVFVLNGATAVYKLSAENEQAGKLRAALETSSPGLVIITLSMGLAALTVMNRSQLQDHPDWDLRGEHPKVREDHQATSSRSTADLERELNAFLEDTKGVPALSPIPD